MDDIKTLKQIIAEQTMEIHQLKKRIDLMSGTDWADGWIYESPDKGNTVYRRKFFESPETRELVDNGKGK